MDMDLKKIEDNNPGYKYTDKISSRASRTVLDSAVQSQLGFSSYNLKYADKVKIARDNLSPFDAKKVDDKNWRAVKRSSGDDNIDLPEESKLAGYDENGKERFGQG